MAKAKKISIIQAEILAAAVSNVVDGERIPWGVPIGMDNTRVYPLAGLIRRGYLKQRRANMYDITPEGEAALTEWQAENPSMATLYIVFDEITDPSENDEAQVLAAFPEAQKAHPGLFVFEGDFDAALRLMSDIKGWTLDREGRLEML